MLVLLLLVMFLQFQGKANDHFPSNSQLLFVGFFWHLKIGVIRGRGEGGEKEWGQKSD